MNLQHAGRHHGNTRWSEFGERPNAWATGRALICAYHGSDVKSYLPGHTC